MLRPRLVIIGVSFLATMATADTLFTFSKESGIERTLAIEKALMEKRFNLVWPDSCRPMIRVGMPEYLTPYQKSRYAGLYQKDSTIIWISPKTARLLNFSDPLSLMDQLLGMSLDESIDHELGHAYADWISRGINRRCWPIFDTTTTPGSGLGLSIQSEGIGETFRRGWLTGVWHPEFWPVQVTEEQIAPGSPMFEMLSYDGGQMLVGALAAKYGLTATVAYVVTHPLVTKPALLRRSVVRWYDQANIDLKKGMTP